MINISGVNARQRAILDILWEMDSLEEVEDWIDNLDDDSQIEAKLMQELIILAVLDDLVNCGNCPDSARIIKHIQQLVDKTP